MTTRIVDQLARHVLDTPFEAFPAETVEAARLRLIDTIGCTLSGARVASNLGVLDLMRSWGGHAQATVLVHGDRVPLQHAAMMNALMCRSFDFEVTGPEAEGTNAGKMVGHVCSTTEPTAVSVAESCGASGKELLAAVILGGDVGARIAVADTFNFDKCFEVCGTANAFGATAVVARLLRLRHEELVNAFGILLNLMGGSFQSLWDGVDTFKLPGAMAAFNAVLSVQMSRHGFGGVKDALTSPQGYFSLYAHDPHPSDALVDLGEVFYAKGMHKLHPSCYGVHNPIESALEIVQKNAIDAAGIEAVTLEVPPHRIKHFLNQGIGTADAQPRALFSIPYGVANVLLRQEVRIAHYTEPFIHDPAVVALAAKVRLVPSLPAGGKNHAGHLTVHMQDGRRFSASREVPLGWADNPVTADQVIEKYWRNVDFAPGIDRGRAARALELLLRIEEVEDVTELPRLLVQSPA